MLTGTSKVTLDIPPDRGDSFNLKLIVRYQCRFPGFGDMVISIYARGMGVREIRMHLGELWGIDVSPDLIPAGNQYSDGLGEVAEWQNCLWGACYTLVLFDTIGVKIRAEGFVRNKAVYITLGHPTGRNERHFGPLDRADQGRDFLAAGNEGVEGARTGRHPRCCPGRPEGFSRSDRRGVSRHHRPDLHRSSDPPFHRLRLLGGIARRSTKRSEPSAARRTPSKTARGRSCADQPVPVAISRMTTPP